MNKHLIIMRAQSVGTVDFVQPRAIVAGHGGVVAGIGHTQATTQ
jgi:hypothetical protein